MGDGCTDCSNECYTPRCTTFLELLLSFERGPLDIVSTFISTQRCTVSISYDVRGNMSQARCTSVQLTSQARRSTVRCIQPQLHPKIATAAHSPTTMHKEEHGQIQ